MAIKDFLSEFECSICMEIPKIGTKVFQCHIGHLLCQACYMKLVVCPTCQTKLVSSSDGDSTYGPVRNLVVENLIRHLPSVQIGELDSVKDTLKQMKDAFHASELQMKEFNINLACINNKLRAIKTDREEKPYMVDGSGFTKVFVIASDSKFAVYWGPERDDINVSSRLDGVVSSIEAACHAIKQANKLGISMLSIVMHIGVPVYDYVMNIFAWKKRNWITSNGDSIPYATQMKALDQCLQKYQTVAVKFTGMKLENSDGLKMTLN